MDSITNKALIIAVGVFVTIAITSGILLTINQMKDIYSKVYETDTNITNRFDEFDAYENAEKTGIEVANAFSKYGSDRIIVHDNSISAYYINSESWWTDTENRIKDGTYSKTYKSTIERNVQNDQVTITFVKK